MDHESVPGVLWVIAFVVIIAGWAMVDFRERFCPHRTLRIWCRRCNPKGGRPDAGA